MPASIGFMTTMKLPFAVLYQFVPFNDGAKKMRSMGFVSPSTVYETQKKAEEDRNFVVRNYKEYRNRMDRYDPNVKKTNESARWPAADANEWDMYLKADTVFDQQVAAALGAGWSINFVFMSRVSKALKRLEGKQGKGHMSVTIWSYTSGAKGGLGE